MKVEQLDWSKLKPQSEEPKHRQFYELPLDKRGKSFRKVKPIDRHLRREYFEQMEHLRNIMREARDDR